MEKTKQAGVASACRGLGRGWCRSKRLRMDKL